VIGAGIVGLATAYALTRAAPGATVTVIEKEYAPARHQTGRNSGVIHSGIYYRPGSLKARYALAGSAETPEFAAKHGVPYEITGKLIVATEPAELPRLAALFQRGREHGLSVTELGPDQITSYEPQAAGLAALHVASTGICDFAALTTVLARLVTEAGGTIVYGQRVTGIERVADGEVVIRTAGTAGTGAGVAAGTGVAAGAGATAGTSTGSRAYGGGSAEPAGAAGPADSTNPADSGGATARTTDTTGTAGVAGAAEITDAGGTTGATDAAGTTGPGGTPDAGRTPDAGGTPYRTRVLINCAGLHSDRIARLAGTDPGMRIVPFRGEYYELVPARRDLVRGLIYPVPDPDFPFLGVHLTRDVHGGVHLGPNAVPALAREGYRRRTIRLRDLADTVAFPGTWRIARRHWRQEVGEIRRSLSKRAFTADARRLLPALRPADLVPAPAGVRAQAVLPDGSLVDDFLFAGSGPFVHVLNAPSPAATAALPIGREVADRALAALK